MQTIGTVAESTATPPAAQADFQHGGVLRFAAHEKTADHSGSGLAIYINNPVGIITTVRALPLKKIFLNPPLGGIHAARKTRLFPKPAEKCAMLLASAGQAAQPAKPLQEVDNMQEDNGMTVKELDRLADWLTAQGLPPEKVLECVKYIAGTSASEKSNG